MSPWPWIAIAPAAVAKFKYPAECVAHRCLGPPYKGPLYYSLNTVGTLPAELHPAMKTLLHEHHGDLALLAPHGLATPPPPPVLAPNTEPGIWFHDLPALATLRGTIAAVYAGTTPAGMAMAGVTQCGHGAYQAHVASRVGTSQEGEAMIHGLTSGGWPSSRECTGWCRTPKQQWGPSILIERGAIVEMVYTTCMPRSWGAVACPRP